MGMHNKNSLKCGLQNRQHASVRRLPEHKKLRCPSIRLGKSLAIGCGIRKSDKFPWYNASIEEVHSTIITKKIRHWWVKFAIKTTTTNKQTNSLTVRLLKDGRVACENIRFSSLFVAEDVCFRRLTGELLRNYWKINTFSIENVLISDRSQPHLCCCLIVVLF